MVKGVKRRLNRIKTVAIASVIACIVLASTLAGSLLYYSSALQQQSERIDELQDQVSDLKDANKNLTATVLNLEAELNFR